MLVSLKRLPFSKIMFSKSARKISWSLLNRLISKTLHISSIHMKRIYFGFYENLKIDKITLIQGEGTFFGRRKITFPHDKKILNLKISGNPRYMPSIFTYWKYVGSLKSTVVKKSFRNFTRRARRHDFDKNVFEVWDTTFPSNSYLHPTILVNISSHLHIINMSRKILKYSLYSRAPEGKRPLLNSRTSAVTRRFSISLSRAATARNSWAARRLNIVITRKSLHAVYVCCDNEEARDKRD